MLADLRTYILADSAIAASIDTRLFLQRVPQSAALPHATYQVIAEKVLNDHGGSSNLDRDIIQIDVYSKTATEALRIKGELKTILNSKRFNQGTTRFGYVSWNGASSGYESAVEEFSQTITVAITHSVV